MGTLEQLIVEQNRRKKAEAERDDLRRRAEEAEATLASVREAGEHAQEALRIICRAQVRGRGEAMPIYVRARDHLRAALDAAPVTDAVVMTEADLRDLVRDVVRASGFPKHFVEKHAAGLADRILAARKAGGCETCGHPRPGEHHGGCPEVGGG